jgi:alpha-1,6-mannosyltransferase
MTEGEHKITMSGMTGSSQDLGDPQIRRPLPPPERPDRLARGLVSSAAGGIGGCLLIMIAAAAVRNGWEHPFVRVPAGGFPWALAARVPLPVVSYGMWAAVIVGAGGVAAGLAALRRGAVPSPRVLLAAGLVAAAALTVAPPAGSTDALDYAAYGRIVALGHSPYVMTPYQLRQAGDPVGRAIPHEWRNHVAVYGPVASAEQWAAAELGGGSAARIVFWLKLWGALAFGAVALALDRMLRNDPARRARAHLLWTANPLLLWVLVAAGHVDVMAAAAGLLGLALIRGREPGAEPGMLQGLAAGLLVGIAADIKISYVLFGVGLAWAARRSLSAWMAAAAGAALVLIPSYAWFGPPAVRALLSREDTASVDNFYQLFVGSHGNVIPHQLLLAGLLFGVVAVALLWRLPDGVPALPAIRPALAVSLAWLFFWPYQLPWYDAMVLCLLALYPASRLDWLVLLRLAAATFALMPGNAGFPPQHLLAGITAASLYWVTPACLLAASAGLVWLVGSQRWKMDRPTVIPAAGPGRLLPV